MGVSVEASYIGVVCPNCIAPLKFKRDARTCHCEYCGGEVRAVEFADDDDDEIDYAFGDTPFLESVRRRLHRCVMCGDDAEPGSNTCEFC